MFDGWTIVSRRGGEEINEHVVTYEARRDAPAGGAGTARPHRCPVARAFGRAWAEPLRVLRRPIALDWGRMLRTARHQTGCGLNPSIAHLGGLMANTPGSDRRTGDHRSNLGGRMRSAVGEDSERPVFHPNNDKEGAGVPRSGARPRARSSRPGTPDGTCDTAPRYESTHPPRDRKGFPEWQSFAPPQRDRPVATVVYFFTAANSGQNSVRSVTSGFRNGSRN